MARTDLTKWGLTNHDRELAREVGARASCMNTLVEIEDIDVELTSIITTQKVFSRF